MIKKSNRINEQQLILQLKERIIELEEQLKDTNILETKHKQLLEDNLTLIKLKNDVEYELNIEHDHYISIINDLKEEISFLQQENEQNKNLNKSLYEANLLLKSDNKKFMNEVNNKSATIQELLNQKKQLELTVHNISKTMIEIKEENTKLFKESDNLLRSNNYFNLNHSDMAFDKNKNRYNSNNQNIFEENSKIKQQFAIMMNQNQNLAKEVERILRNHSDFVRLDKILEENKRITKDSLNHIDIETIINSTGIESNYKKNMNCLLSQTLIDHSS